MKYILLLGLFFCVFQQAPHSPAVSSTIAIKFSVMKGHAMGQRVTAVPVGAFKPRQTRAHQEEPFPIEVDRKNLCFAVTRCINGMQMTGATATEEECPVTHSCSRVTGTITVSMLGVNQTSNILIGQCVLDIACSFMKCTTIMSNLPPQMPGTFGNCRASCCKNGECSDVLEDGGPPIVPYGGSLLPETPARETLPLPVRETLPLPVPENMPALPVPENMPALPAGCPVPLWSNTIMDNWNGIARRGGRPAPKFELSIKAVDKHRGYKSGKTYKYMIKSNTKTLRMNGYFILLTSNSSSCGCKEEGAAMCPVGNFISSRKRIAGAPIVQPGCDSPIVVDYTAALKKSKGSWRAPACTDAEVVMRAVVRGVDGRLYHDNDEVSEKFLTKVIRPASKKAKKPKKPKRRRS